MKKQPKKNGLEFYSTSYLKNKKDPRRVLRYQWRIWKQGRIIGASTEDYTRLKGAEKNVASIWIALGGNSAGVFTARIEKAAHTYKSRKK